MLRLIDLAVARGARTLYRNVSLIAPPGERIGLIGANGSGKSSLFTAILGDLAVDSGAIEAPPLERIAHVAQDIEASEESRDSVRARWTRPADRSAHRIGGGRSATRSDAASACTRGAGGTE